MGRIQKGNPQNPFHIHQCKSVLNFVNKIFFTDLNVPILNWYMVDADINRITVFWRDGDCTHKNVDYIISVSNLTHPDPINYVTNLKNITLSLMKGIHYTITVTAQLCGGNVTSESSEPLHLYFPGLFYCQLILICLFV